jgi:hypothetical protein
MVDFEQGKTAMDLSFLRSPTSDAVQVLARSGQDGAAMATPNCMHGFDGPLQVVWGEEPDESWTDAHFLPNSTCTEVHRRYSQCVAS